MKVIYASLVFVALQACLLSCSKSNDTNLSSFTWNFRDTIYTAKSDTAYLSGLAATPILAASDKPNLNAQNARVTITSASFSEGSYTFDQGDTKLRYIDNLGYEYNGGNGTLNITSNRNNLLSGNFSLIVTGPSATTPAPNYALTGNFTNVPVKP